MKRLLTYALALIGTSIGAQAQWVQTQGPEGGNAAGIAHVNGATIAVMRPDALYRLASGASRWTRIGTLRAEGLLVAGDAVLAMTPERMMRSTDAGESWLPVGPARPMMLQGVDGAVAFATGEGLWRSTDDGATWSSFEGNIRSHVVGEYTPGALAGIGDTILAGETFTPGILRSSDGGATWSRVTSGLPDSAEAAVIAQIDGAFFAQMVDEDAHRMLGVWRSLDGGLSWRELNEGLPTFGDQGAFVFSFHKEGQLVTASTVSGIYQLVDSSWVGNGNDLLVGTATDDDGRLLRATLGGVRRSDDGGQTWERVDGGLLSLQISGITAVAGRVIASSSAGTFSSVDRGLTWERNGAERLEEFASDGGVLLGRGASLSSIGLARSTDGGLSWTPAAAGIEHVVNGTTSIAAGTGVMYAGFNDPIHEPTNALRRLGAIYRSTDGGASWTQLRNGLPAVFDSSVAVLAIAASADTAVILTFHGIYRSTDRGESWTIGGAGMLTPQSIRALRAHRGLFYAAANSEVWVSSDAGANWSLTGRPGERVPSPISSLASFGDALVAVATGDGPSRLFMLANDAWQRFSVVPDGVEARQAVLSDGRIYVATEANSVMRLDVAPSAVEQELPASRAAWTPTPLRGDSPALELTLEHEADIQLELVDLTGRLVTEARRRLASGRSRIELPVSGLRPGAYGYRLSIDGHRSAGVVIVAE